MSLRVGSGKIINCYSSGTCEGNTIGGISGLKTNYGVHYIENCYWAEELGINCSGVTEVGGSGKVEITNSEQYLRSYMKTEEFLKRLNNYVEEYNQTDKEFSSSEEISKWVFDEETGYPTLDIKK